MVPLGCFRGQLNLYHGTNILSLTGIPGVSYISIMVPTACYRYTRGQLHEHHGANSLSVTGIPGVGYTITGVSTDQLLQVYQGSVTLPSWYQQPVCYRCTRGWLHYHHGTNSLSVTGVPEVGYTTIMVPTACLLQVYQRLVTLPPWYQQPVCYRCIKTAYSTRCKCAHTHTHTNNNEECLHICIQMLYWLFSISMHDTRLMLVLIFTLHIHTCMCTHTYVQVYMITHVVLSMPGLAASMGNCTVPLDPLTTMPSSAIIPRHVTSAWCPVSTDLGVGLSTPSTHTAKQSTSWSGSLHTLCTELN